MSVGGGAGITQLPVVGRSGSYAGNDAANRAIPHGLGRVPTLVFIGNEAQNLFFILGGDPDFIVNATATGYAVTAMDSTNFYVGNIGSFAGSANGAGANYHWSAV